eukprot:GHVO01020922.1.p2 GENE.GHVO01020922.1~~GHVO01020922.1.p2  ORF type:complete len:103 (-),score=4.48 GHVO01020922.1:74-355(-)
MMNIRNSFVSDVSNASRIGCLIWFCDFNTNIETISFNFRFRYGSCTKSNRLKPIMNKCPVELNADCMEGVKGLRRTIKDCRIRGKRQSDCDLM